MNRKLKDNLAWLLRFTGKIPGSFKILYPFWLAAQLDEKEEVICFENLPQDLDGFVIALASDPHYGPFLGRDRVIDLSRRLNNMRADVIILAGDYGVDTKTAAEFFNILPKLFAKYGVYASLGNHDHKGSEKDIACLLDTIHKSEINILSNNAQAIIINQTSLCICATDDILEGQPDFGPLKQAVSQSNFVVFAPHSPDILPTALKEKGFQFDLALCGHTHGGQLVVLGRSLHSSSKFGNRFRTGLIVIDSHQLLVTNGVGTSLLPMRLGAKPQIHRITLKKAKP